MMGIEPIDNGFADRPLVHLGTLAYLGLNLFAVLRTILKMS